MCNTNPESQRILHFQYTAYQQQPQYSNILNNATDYTEALIPPKQLQEE